MSYTLGIDLGTTSVKVTIIDNQNLFNKVYSKSKATASDVKGDPNLGESLQDVSKIYQTLLHLIQNAPQEVLDSVTSIGVCGQMHGIVYWKDKEAWTYNLKEELQVGSGVSYLHTWQDSRCSPEFLATLPPASTRVNSGYGCATTFWYLQNLPHFIQQFDRCGTVMDFLVSMILNLEVPVMSDQNAVSFGYYNPSSEDWDRQVLSSAGFPTKILPKVVPAGTCAGNLPSSWQGIKAGTPVFVAMGDFQASVKSMQENENEDGILNISTSAQIAFLIQRSEKEKYSLPKSIDFFPYFKNTDLAVAASLNGGNVLASFVSMIEDWTRTLGLDISEERIWSTLLEVGSSSTDNNQESNSQASLQIVPTIFGERHNPQLRGSINNIRNDNLSLSHVVKALYQGLVDNLTEMMPPSLLQEHNYTKIK